MPLHREERCRQSPPRFLEIMNYVGGQIWIRSYTGLVRRKKKPTMYPHCKLLAVVAFAQMEILRLIMAVGAVTVMLKMDEGQ